MYRELIAGVRMITTAIRFNPGGLSAQILRESNLRSGEALFENGRLPVGTSMPGKESIYRPAHSNWHAPARVVADCASDVVELGQRLS
jgi:hypothetical protein